MTITTELQPNGRVRLYENGSPYWFVECTTEQADAAIKHHLETTERHFGEIAERQQANDPRLVVAMHMGRLMAFSIGSPNDYPRGFGGDTWHIYFFDGRIETTCSLWCMGEVPTDWQDRIVKNARFGHGLKLKAGTS